MARGFARRTLSAWLATREGHSGRPPHPDPDEEVLENVPLLVTELVTNAVRHSKEPIKVTLVAHADRIRISVWDSDSERLPRLIEEAQAEAIRSGNGVIGSGHGLVVVSALTTTWGVDPGPAGKSVWCELLLPPGSRLADADCQLAQPRGAKPTPA